MEIMESTYTDYNAAIQAGAVGEGKALPELLPESAKDIRKSFDIDTNEVRLFFHFNAKNLSSIEKKCEEILHSEVVLPNRRTSKWWPKNLTKPHQHKLSQDISYLFFYCIDGSNMTIDTKNNTAYYWK
ncbi:MAG: hypothetical protein V3T30_07780 [Thermodesulfobacteriota bacterium]